MVCPRNRNGLTGGALLSTLIILTAVLSGCHSAENADITAFPSFSIEGTNILLQVERFVALGPRVSGTPGAAAAADWLAQELSAHGINADTDAFTDKTPSGPVLFRNVTGIIHGRTPGNARVLLLSHYDTKGGISDDFYGANDSGSSTGLLLETARIIQKIQPPFPFDLWFCFVDGEECAEAYGPHDGLHGSRRLAEQISNDGLPPPLAVIVVDMIGDSDLRITIPRNSSPQLTALALDVAEKCGLRSYLGISRNNVIDDHVPFLQKGLNALLLIDFEYGSSAGLNNYWHTTEDTMDKLSADSLAVSGKILVDILRKIAENTAEI